MNLLFSGMSRRFKRPWKRPIDKLRPRKSVAFTVNTNPAPRGISKYARVYTRTPRYTPAAFSVTSGEAHPLWPQDSIRPESFDRSSFPTTAFFSQSFILHAHQKGESSVFNHNIWLEIMRIAYRKMNCLNNVVIYKYYDRKKL